MAPCPDSLLSLTLNCPALGVQSSFILRLKNCEGDELLQCINDFRCALRSKDLITLEKGEMCSSQELLIEGLLFQRLGEWQERLRRCQQIEEEKQGWENKLQNIRVDYIREIELQRLKLRAYEAQREPQDKRKSSMAGVREVEVQTDLQAPLPEIMSLWEKSLDLQQRLETVFRRNMALDQVEDCIFKVHRAVLDDQHHNAYLEKALMELVELLSCHQWHLSEARQLAMQALEGRDVTAISREDISAMFREELRRELQQAMSGDSLEALEALVHGEEHSKTEQLVLQLRGMVRRFQDLQDENDFTAKKRDPVPHGYLTHLLGISEAKELEMPPMHPHVAVIRDALSSAKALNETLELVKTASQKWRQSPAAPNAATPASPSAVASADSVVPSQISLPAEAERSLNQEDLDPATATLATSMAPSEDESSKSPLSRGEVLSQADEHIIEAPAESDAELEGLGTDGTPLTALASREDLVVTEAQGMVSDASTMTAPHLLLTSLLKSKDVVWTSVPLGSEKNFQWSLMPALKHGPEAGFSELERGFKRMDALLEAVPLPSKVLAGRVPGTLWPSISPMAWSHLGGGLELARITSEPPSGAAGAALRALAFSSRPPKAERAAQGGHGTSCAEALDLQPTTSTVRFSEWRSPSREVARMSKKRARSAHGRFSESKEGDEVIGRLERREAEVFVTVPQVSAVTERRRRDTEKVEGDDQLVQQWLARLREPLPAVSKFEQEPRHATSLVSVTSEFPESCRRYSHDSAPEVFIYFDDNSTEPDSRSRPSTAHTGPSRPSSAATGPSRPWTGRRPLPMSKVASTRDEEPEVSEAHDAVTEETWQLPRAPAFVPRVPPMRRIAAAKSRPGSSKRPRPATAERKVHRAYVCHRPASAA